MSGSQQIQMPSAVFWDWDGTLADSYGYLNDAHNFTLQSLGFPPFKGDEYKEYFGKPREVLYPAIYKDRGEEAKEIFQQYVFENSYKIKTIENSKPVLDFFLQRNIKMGIVSNKKASFIAQELKYLKWEHYFSVIVGAGDACADKPSGAPLSLALERSNLESVYENIWYVGDTENDLACAQEVGCHAIFLRDGAHTTKLLEKYDPLISFDNYVQLKEILVAI